MLRIWGELQMHLSSVPLFAFLATWRLCANSRWTCRTKHRAENTCPVFPANHHTECDCYCEAVTVIFRTMLTEGHTSSYASIRKRLRLTVPQHLLRLGAQRRKERKAEGENGWLSSDLLSRQLVKPCERRAIATSKRARVGLVN